MIATGPEMLLAGVKFRVPSGFTVTLPCEGVFSTALVTVNGSDSASRSFKSTATVTGVLMAVEARSLTATGASLTALTLSERVEVDESEPSLTV